MNQSRILIVDDEKAVRDVLAKVLRQAEFDIDFAVTGSQGVAQAKICLPDLVILDLKLPDLEGMEVLKQLKTMEPRLPVIILTGHESLKTAVEAMKKGAFHYLAKPFDNEELLVIVKKALEVSRVEQEMLALRHEVERQYVFKKMIGDSEAIRKVIKLVKAVAETNATVLLTGASGTGKELIARSIHHASHRHDKRFTPVDCASLPSTLIESELFGAERGAFTGAGKTRMGKFEVTEGGTIFLDEIGNVSLEMQPKLLRVLEERTVEKLGGNHPIEVDVRVIAATNIDLEEAVKKGTFRRDLYHRLQEFPIPIPALRERAEDILLLAEHFIKEFNSELNLQIRGISMGVKALMMAYSWPGNVRELRNIIKRAMIMADSDILTTKSLPKEIRTCQSKLVSLEENAFYLDSISRLPLKEAVQEVIRRVEIVLIKKVLQEAGGKMGDAAQRLGVDDKTLYNKRKEYRLLD